MGKMGGKAKGKGKQSFTQAELDWELYGIADDDVSRSHGKGKGKGSSAGTGKGKGKGKAKGNNAGKGSKGGKGKGSKGNGGQGGKGKSYSKRSEPRKPDPPVDTPGQWVYRDDFRGRKSFGFYVCGCGRSWTTAHAQKNVEEDEWFCQGCQGCDSMLEPYYVWENDPSSSPRDRSDRDLDDEKPHDFDRCEACRLGKCTALRTGYRTICSSVY